MSAPRALPDSAVPPIRSWSDGFAALRQRAIAMRGSIELDTDAPDRRWPRTTGLDVIVIAAFLDEAFRRTDTRRWPGTALRWASCKDDIERDALGALSEPHSGNRGFWSCAAMLCAHLGSIGAPLPTRAAWLSVLGQIGDSPRNASGDKDDPPLRFAGMTSNIELYQAQRAYLGKQRGVDRMVPEPGMSGSSMPVPRSTNDEAIKLTEFWTAAIDRERSKNYDGYARVRAQWAEVERAIALHARGHDPTAPFAKNHLLWRGISAVARHSASANESGLTDAQQWMADVGDTVAAIPATIGDLGSKVLSGAEAGARAIVGAGVEVAQETGSAVGSFGRGVSSFFGNLFTGLTKPLAIGGAIVAGLWLLRGRSS